MTTPSSNTNRNVVLPVVNNGFRPQLYIAKNGSYASNAVYGSGVGPDPDSALAVNTYDSVTLRSLNQTRANVRKEDKDVYFDLDITLDSTATDPFDGIEVAGDELRIRVQKPLALGEPGAYLNQLPLPDYKKPLPLFFECDIINVTTGQPILPSLQNPSSLLQARMLTNGDLALIRRDISSGPPTDTPLIILNISPLFGQSVAANIRISVKGYYKTN